MSVTYAKPPINEVVLGQVFLPRTDFLVPHYGLFWSLLREQYPEVAHAEPIADADGSVVSDPSNGTILPRVWLLSRDSDYLIQIQQNRLHLNWRKRNPEKEYPRYNTIRDEFFRIRDLFNQFVENETGTPIIPVRYELNYVNIIDRGDGWDNWNEIGNILSNSPWSGHGDGFPPLKNIAARYEFELPSDVGALRATIAPVLLRAKKKDGFRLELNVTSPQIESNFDGQKWCQEAHDWIIKAFSQLTTKEMQLNNWELQDKNGSN